MLATKMAEEQEPAAQGSIHIHPVPIQPACEFNPDADDCASFEMFLTGGGITDKKQMRALLLYQARAVKRHGNREPTARPKLKDHFKPLKNRRYEQIVMAGTSLRIRKRTLRDPT